MSWDSYRDTLTASGHVHKAAIVGVEGGVWTKHADFDISQDEIKNLNAAFANPSQLREKGVIVAGQKYMYLQSDDQQIQGKKGATGISVAKATKCLIIGTYTDGQQAGNCRTNVERIRDYLVTSGY